MKSETKQLSNAAVDAILQEAAEAFAIEMAAQENYDVPDIEEVARDVRNHSRVTIVLLMAWLLILFLTGYSRLILLG